MAKSGTARLRAGRSGSGDRPRWTQRFRFLTVTVAVTVLLSLAGQDAWATPAPVTPSTPQQRSGSAAGLSHRAPSAIRSAKGAVQAPGNARTAPKAAVTPRLSNVPQTATPGRQPARVTSRTAVASGQEVVGQRTATRSVYANGDGTFTAKVYSQPVHYQTGNGAWADIDTTLVRQPNGTYQEKANAASPTFGATGDGRALLDTSLGANASLSFALQGAAPAVPSVSGNQVTYQGILPNAAVTYAANAAGVKEILVLDNASAPTTWTFPLALHGVTAALDADGAVVLKDAVGAVVQTIPHGFMRDSNVDPRSNEGVLSTGVTYALTTVNGQQALQVSLDPAWVHDPARVFPINVDPSSLNTSGSTYVLSPFRNDFSGDSVLQVGTYDGGTHVANSYLMFNMGAFTNDYIEAATLNLNNVHSWSCSGRPVFVSQILTGWSVSGLKTYPWVSYGGTIGQSTFAAGNSGCAGQWESIDLGDNPSAFGTQMVESWAHGGMNFGIAVTASATDSYGYKQFSSINTPYAPYLSITYSPYGADYAPAGTYVVPTANVAGSQQVTITNRGNSTWTPGAQSLGYQLFNMNWQRLSVGATTTALPGNVGPNQTFTMTGTIGALTPGQYILCWDMMVGGTSFNLGYGVPTAGCEVINSNNTPPQIDSTSPLSNAVLGSLTPTVSATGHDPDNYPGSGHTYNFQVYLLHSDGSAATYLTSPGWSASSTWTIPAGQLAWNQSYYWIVQNSDSIGASSWSNPSYFSTAVPQPLVTSHLGSANSSGRSFDPGVGDYTTSATDAKVSVVGPALSIVRSYNSQDPRTSNLFGAGWSTVYDMAAVPDADGSGNVVVTYPDGHTVRFGLNPDGTTYTPPQGTYATFQTVSGGGYTLTARGGTTYTFTTPVGSGWKLTAITDADHRSETLSYSGGQLTTVTNAASNRALHFIWVGGHPTSVATDPATIGGQPLTWTYGYSGSALTSVCPAATPTKCTSYGYTSGSGSGSHYRSMVLDAGPTSYWRLAEPTGTTTATDEVAANLGTTNGVYSTSGFGHYPGPAPGSAAMSGAYFGANADVALPNGTVANTGGYLSISLWFQTGSGNSGPLFGYQDHPMPSPSGPAVPALYVGGDGRLYGEFWPGLNTNPTTPIITSGVVNDGRWHQAVLTGAGTTQSLYLDGQLVGSENGPVLPQGIMYDQIGGAYVSTPNFWPGMGAAPVEYFRGLIGEVSVYNHPLGAPAIAQQYQAGTQAAVELTSITTPNGATAAQMSYDNVADRATQVTDIHGGTWKIEAPVTAGSSLNYRGAVLGTEPVDYWPLGESSGAQAANALPPGAISNVTTDGNGTYNNVTLGVPGPFAGAPDTAASFNGANSSMSVPSVWQHSSVGLWFKTTTPGGVLLDGANMPELYIGSDSRLHGDFAGSGLLASKVVTDGAWHYAVLAARFDSSETLYLDGAVAQTATPPPVNGSAGILVVGAGAITSAAAAAPANNPNGFYTGSIADVQVNDLDNLDDPTVASLYATAQTASTNPTPFTAVAVTDPGNATLRYSYDPTHWGRLATATDGLGNTTTYGRDGNGFVTTVMSPDSDAINTQYDVRGNLLSRSVPFGSGGSSNYTYPAVGTYAATDPRDDEPLAYTDNNGHQTTYSYSAGGDLLTSTNALGAVTTITVTVGTEPAVGGGTEPPGLLATQKDPLGHVTTYSYDSGGDLAKTVTPSGLTTTHTRDNLGRLLSQTQISDTFPGGVTISYSYDGNGRVLTQTGPATTDAVTGTVHTPQTTNTYDADGDLLTATVADLTGHDTARATTNVYNGDDELASVTDPAGRKTSYGYDTYGNKTSLTDPAGKVYSSTYDPNGHLLTVTLHGWTGNTATPASPTDLVVDSRAYDPDGLLATDTDAMGRMTQYDYTAEHWVQGVGHSLSQFASEGGVGYGSFYGFDGVGHVTNVYGPAAGLTVTNTYDAANRIVSHDTNLTGSLPGNGSEKLEPVTNYSYDADNNLTAQSTVNGTVTEQTAYAYDAANDRVSQSVQDGATALTTSWTYDQRGVQISMTDPRGNVTGATAANFTTTYTTDTAGRTVLVAQPTINTESQGGTPAAVHPVTEYGYDTFGEKTSVSDPNGNITSNTYDPNGELIGVSQPAYLAPGTTTAVTPTTTFGYTPLGQVATVTDPLGNVTTSSYDQRGDLVQQTQPAVGGTPTVSTFTYDNDGEQLSATSPAGAQTQATYDDIGQLLTSTQIERHPTPAAYTTTHTYDLSSNQRGDPAAITLPGGQKTTFTWDQAGQPLSLVDPLGNTTINNYDLDLNLIKTTLPDGTATTNSYDPAGRQIGSAQLDATGTALRTTSAGYDPAGNQTSTTNGTGVTSTTTFDAANRQVGQVQPVSASSSITTGTGYDAAGNITRYTSGNGTNTIYTYNPLGLPETRIDPTVPGYTTAATSTTTIAYNANGQQVGVTEPGGVAKTMTYDALGRLTGQSGSGAEAATTTRTLGYDQAGNLTSVNTPTGTDTYTYNDRGNMLTAAGPSGTASYAYNSNGQLTSRTDTTGTATFGYDGAGRLATAADPLTSTTASYSYNPLSQVTGVSYGTGAASQTYGYNTAHELTSQSVLTGAGATEASIAYGYDLNGWVTSQTTIGTAGAATNTYTYDQAGRLATWNNGTSTTSYGFDGDGNRTQVGAATATFNARDQLTVSGATSYTYTARGTLSSQTTGTTTTSYAYNAFDQLTTVGGITHTYDGLGRDATAGTASFTYDGISTTPTGDGSQTFGYGPTGQLDSVGGSAGASLVLANQHGDVTGLFTSSGSGLSSSVAFDPWGQPIASIGARADRGYQGGWTDPTNGFVGTASRWYNPATATFTSRDTNPVNPHASAAAANPYAYGNGDPIDLADSSGLSACGAGGAPSASASGGGSGGGWGWGFFGGIGSSTGSSSSAGHAGGGGAGSAGGPPSWWAGVEGAVIAGVGAAIAGWSAGPPAVPVPLPEPMVPVGGGSYGPGPGEGEGSGPGGISGIEAGGGGAKTYGCASSPLPSPGGGNQPGRSVNHPRPTAPPPPPGFQKPNNPPPIGQSDPAGDIITKQPGTKTPDSGPGDTPINTGLLGEANPAAGPAPEYHPANVPGPAGVGNPGPLLPAQGQLDGAVCTGGLLRDAGDGSLSRTAIGCESGGSDSALNSADFGFGPPSPLADLALVNLASDARMQHILSGHMPPGEPGNSLFPIGWSAAKIMNGVSEVATDPANLWIQQTGRLGAEFTRAGDPVRYVVQGLYDSLKIRVIVEPGGEGIITGFPVP